MPMDEFVENHALNIIEIRKQICTPLFEKNWLARKRWCNLLMFRTVVFYGFLKTQNICVHLMARNATYMLSFICYALY